MKDNEYLEDFYLDMKKYSFPMQVLLLNRRFAQQQQIIWGNQGGVQDRTIYEDSVFARMLRDAGLMEERDFRTYTELAHHMHKFMTKPNVIVHLNVTPEQALARIHARSRSCESGITLEYLQNLAKAYEDFLADIARAIPVIRVDYEEFRTVDEMAERIADEYARLANVRHVTWTSPGTPLKVRAKSTEGEASTSSETAAASETPGKPEHHVSPGAPEPAEA